MHTNTHSAVPSTGDKAAVTFSASQSTTGFWAMKSTSMRRVISVSGIASDGARRRAPKRSAFRTAVVWYMVWEVGDGRDDHTSGLIVAETKGGGSLPGLMIGAVHMILNSIPTLSTADASDLARE